MGIFDLFKREKTNETETSTSNNVVSLRKEAKVNLRKNQRVTLTKTMEESGENIRYAFVGANWSKLKNGINVDLDSSIIEYDEDLNIIDIIYFGNLRSSDGSIKHSGDDREGDNSRDDKDNEVISIDFNKINPRATYLVSVLNNYTHQKFGNIPNIELRIYTNENGNKNNIDNVLVSYKIDNNEEYSKDETIVLGHFHKVGDRWNFTADGIGTKEKSVQEISMNSAKNVCRE